MPIRQGLSASRPWQDAAKTCYGRGVMSEKVDPTMRVVMWLCAEKRVHAGLSQPQMALHIIRRNGKIAASGATLSRFESGERWLNASRPVLAAYADVAGLASSVPLWDEAIRLTRWFGFDVPELLEAPAADYRDAVRRVDQLRARERKHRLAS